MFGMEKQILNKQLKRNIYNNKVYHMIGLNINIHSASFDNSLDRNIYRALCIRVYSNPAVTHQHLPETFLSATVPVTT